VPNLTRDTVITTFLKIWRIWPAVLLHTSVAAAVVFISYRTPYNLAIPNVLVTVAGESIFSGMGEGPMLVVCRRGYWICDILSCI
jgi:hypothetical protein